MPLQNTAGDEYDTTTIAAAGTEEAQDPIIVIQEDIWETFTYPGDDEPDQGRRLRFHAGQRVAQSEWDRATADVPAPAGG